MEDKDFEINIFGKAEAEKIIAYYKSIYEHRYIEEAEYNKSKYHYLDNEEKDIEDEDGIYLIDPERDPKPEILDFPAMLQKYYTTSKINTQLIIKYLFCQYLDTVIDNEIFI